MAEIETPPEWEKLVEQAQGTCQNIDNLAEGLGLDIATTPGLSEFVDDRIFCCTECDWWCDINEEVSAFHDLSDLTCSDCAPEEDEED